MKVYRRIVQINEEKCNGCGLCIPACHEGAIEIIDGKARLLAEKLCDGIGDCLGECPLGAIEIIEREADDVAQDGPRDRQVEHGFQARLGVDHQRDHVDGHGDRADPARDFRDDVQMDRRGTVNPDEVTG